MLFNGKDRARLASAEARAARSRVQMIFQDPYRLAQPTLARGDHHRRGAAACTASSRAPSSSAFVDELLKRVGLDAAFKRRFPHQFSGGQRQRIGIARALAVQPEFLVCDEAVAALDVSIQAQIINLFMDLRAGLRSDLSLHQPRSRRRAAHLATASSSCISAAIVEKCAVGGVVRGAQPSLYARLLAEVPRTRHATTRSSSRSRARSRRRSIRRRGCHFHPRCPLAMARCAEVPALKPIAPGRLSACHLNDRPSAGDQSMDINRLLEPSRSRTPLALAAVFAIALLAVGRVWLDGWDWKTLAGTADELIATIVVTFTIAVIFWRLYPDLLRNSPLKVVPAVAIGGTLKGLRQHATAYWFVGRTGRDFRVKALPILEANARTRGQPLQVTAIILDPTDPSICKRYALTRNAARFRGRDDVWTAEKVKIEALASVVAIFQTAWRCSLVNVSVSLARTLSTFRMDMSDEGLLLTVEDDRHSALWFSAGTDFVSAFRREVEFQRDGSMTLSVLRPVGETAAEARTAVIAVVVCICSSRLPRRPRSLWRMLFTRCARGLAPMSNEHR